MKSGGFKLEIMSKAQKPIKTFSIKSERVAMNYFMLLSLIIAVSKFCTQK